MAASRYFTLAWFLCFAACLRGSAGDKPWIEVRSPHFRVLSDGSDKNVRRVANEFEQIRTVFASGFPNMRLDSGAPLVVLAPRDENSMKAMAPEFWKQKGAKPAGFFKDSEEKRYAVVQLDEDAPGAYQVVYHEYVHTLLHLNFRWLPVWLDEGLAEYYGSTRFERSRMYVGAPTSRVYVLRDKPLIPLDVLLAVNRASPYYRDEDKVQMFYAESWALTHFLTFGPAMESGKRLNEFYGLLQQGVDEKHAFKQVFGDFKDVGKNLDQYARKFVMPSWVLETPPQIDEKNFAVRSLSLAETEAELGDYHLRSHNIADARRFIEQALKNNPQLGLAHEDMGFLDFTDGKDEDAVREFAQAEALDGKLYLSTYFRTMLSLTAQSNAQQTSFHEGLLKTLDLNPDFAPVYVQLARLHVRQGDLTHALADARKAAQLEPSLAGYHLLCGLILLRMGHGTEASALAKYVADHWYGADHDEAVELWNNVPATQRPVGDHPHTEALPQGWQTVEGMVKSATCGDEGLSLVLDHDGQPLSFHAAKNAWHWGYSDTIWYGEDHFSVCHHVEGMRGVVHYKPSSDTSNSGELVELGLREDLPGSLAVSKTEEAKPEENR